MKKVLTKTEKTIKEAEKVLETGFNSTYEKEQIVKGLEAARKDLYVIPKDAPAEVIEQKVELVEKLTTLTEEVDSSSNYKAEKDITSNFSKAEKKIIQAMLEVLTRNFERPTVDSLYKEFLEELKKKG